MARDLLGEPMQRQGLLRARVGRTGRTVESGMAIRSTRPKRRNWPTVFSHVRVLAGGSGQGFRARGVGLPISAEEALGDRLGAKKGAEPQQLRRLRAQAPEGDGEGG